MELHQAFAEAIFEEALRLPAEKRVAFVEKACAHDHSLCQRICRLLQAEAEAGSFLGEPVSLGIPITPENNAADREGERPGDRIGRYKLLQRIAEGGMGVVYMAEQEEPVRRRVALKIIKPGMDTRQVVARFEAERQALALMVHPNIAQVLDGGATQAGRPYFVMELVQGVPITEFCDKNELRIRDRLKLFIQVCHAIQSAHQKGIIHRDIKPSNVLVTFHNGEPMPKVIDFGVAKATNQRLTEKTLFTQHATMIGTPAYMSPEQAGMSSMDVDTRTDVYALGVLLYELLTGTTPFPEKRLRSLGYGEMQRVIVEEEPQRPSTRLSTLANEQKTATAWNNGDSFTALSKLLKGDLDWIIMKCLEKDRTRRYETASDLAADVRRHLSDEPVVASPPGRFYRFQKAVRRNKPAFLAAATVTFALILGVIVSTRLTIWANREKADAVQARDESEQRAQAEAKARIEARNQRVRAEREEARSRERLVRLNVSNGAQLLNVGDHYRALLWFHEAFKSDFPALNRSRIHRLRLAAVVNASPNLVQVLRADGAIKGLSLSPDGKELRVIHQDPNKDNRRWQLFDVESGRSHSPHQSHSDAVLAFHHNSSELLVASNNVTFVRNARTGEPLAPLRGITGPIAKAALSPEAAAVLVVQSNLVRVWNSRTGEPKTPPLPQPGKVEFVEFNPDGSRFVVATSVVTKWSDQISITEGGHVRVWDTHSGQPITPEIDSGSVGACVFSPDGQLLLSVAGDQVHGWNLATGTETVAIIGGDNPAPVNRAAFSPDGRRFITAHGNSYRKGEARIWEAQTSKLWKSLIENGAPVKHAVFSPGGDLVATASADQAARIWNVENSSPVTPQLWHESDIVAISFAPDGRRLITGTIEGMIRIWDLAGHRMPRSMPHGGRVIHAEFSRDGGTILTACYDGKIRLWDASTGELGMALDHLVLERGGIIRAAYWAGFSPDGSRVLSIGGDFLKGKGARIWNSLTGTNLLHIPNATLGRFSPDGRWIATAGKDMVRMCDANTGSNRVQLEHLGYLDSLQFSSDGARLLTVGRDKKARLRNVSDGRDVGDLTSEDGLANQAMFTPDGSRIGIACEDGTIRFRDALTGRPQYSLPKHPAAVNELNFSSDGRKLLARSGGLVRILDANSGQPLAPALQHASEVDGARFSTDGNLIATWSHHAKKVRWWDAVTGQPMGPPLHHDGHVDVAAFHPEKLQLLTTDSTAAYQWNFSEEHRPLQELDLLYQLHSSASIDESGSMVTLNADALISIWTRLRENHHNDLSVSPLSRSAWYHERAVIFETKGEWPLAIFYLEGLVETDPANLKARERLASASVEHWKSQLLKRGDNF